jgi:hypothetical protein
MADIAAARSPRAFTQKRRVVDLEIQRRLQRLGGSRQRIGQYHIANGISFVGKLKDLPLDGEVGFCGGR